MLSTPAAICSAWCFRFIAPDESANGNPINPDIASIPAIEPSPKIER